MKTEKMRSARTAIAITSLLSVLVGPAAKAQLHEFSEFRQPRWQRPLDFERPPMPYIKPNLSVLILPPPTRLGGSPPRFLIAPPQPLIRTNSVQDSGLQQPVV